MGFPARRASDDKNTIIEIETGRDWVTVAIQGTGAKTSWCSFSKEKHPDTFKALVDLASAIRFDNAISEEYHR